MLFNSLEFLTFLPIVLAIYFILPWRAQNRFLLAASIFFYASWNWKFVFPLLFSTTTDYFVARKLERLRAEGAPRTAGRRYLVLSLVTNLGLLGFFKYFNFFAGNMHELFMFLGVPFSLPVLDIILPVGISFYTFQALAYTFDVYRGEAHATKSFWDFFLAVLYFPHLVAGPIQRASNLLAQVTAPRKVTGEKWAEGIHLIFCGYLKKVFIADNLAPLVARVFAEQSAPGFEVLIGVFAFGVQIYCDFSGYTDIARGVAKLMGFEFMLNFNLPYFARNPQDFWRRWHISLSTWLRDYLYISLGGSRGSTAFIYRNLFLTMLIGGLWHGAAWNFVLWGGYHGALLVGHRAVSPYFVRAAPRASQSKLFALLSMLLMFVCTCYGWLLFRATSFNQVAQMTTALFSPLDGFNPDTLALVLMYGLPLFLVQAFEYAWGNLNLFSAWRIPAEVRVVCYGIITYVVLFRGGLPQSFIYFQF
jgi:alginate O-acetyltransferase complex protein AlgI